MINIKSIIIILFLVAFTTAILTGCAPSYIDGNYRVEMSDYDSLGFKEFLTATVTNGEVVSVNIGAVDRSGVTKTDNEEYRIAMELATGTNPETVYETLDGRYLLLAQDQNNDESVDAVAGATITSNNYAALFEELKKSFVTGETLIIVDNLVEE